MLKTAIALILAAIAVTLCCTGCMGDEESHALDNVSEDTLLRDVAYFSKDVNFTQPGSFLVTGSKMEVAFYGNAEYAFGTEIGENIRTECVLATHTLLQYLDVYTDMKILMISDEGDKKCFVENGTVYITGFQEFKSVDYIASVLPAIFGEYCNYGLVYGYASFLCEELFGIKTKTNAPVFEKDWQYYDINLLCFNGKFVSANDEENAKNISCDFVKKYIKENGMKSFNRLLISSGKTDNNSLFLQALSDYYTQNGVTPVLSEILYGYGGFSYHYYAVCDYAVFCVPYDWKDRLQERAPEAYNGFLNFDYAQTRRFFEVNEKELKQLRDVFGLESYKEGLYITYTDQNPYYFKESHIIQTPSHAHTRYNYIYSLLCNTELKMWQKYGIAGYFGNKYNEYGVHVLNEHYKNRGNGPVWEFANAFVEKTGRDIDVSKDMTDLQHIYVYYNNDYGLESTDSAASFVEYLISVFGEEKIVDYVVGRIRLEDITEKSLDTLKSDWKDYVETEYSEYTKRK